MVDSINIALLILRVVTGLLFFGHGAQKLFGWFGGKGLEATTGIFSQMGVRPPKFWALIAGLSEALGGLGIVSGLFTPLAAAAIIAVMLMAMIKVHWKNGIWNTQRGIELNLVYVSIALALGIASPGRFSLDNLLGLAYPVRLFPLAMLLAVLGVIAGLYSAGVNSPDEKQQPSQR